MPCSRRVLSCLFSSAVGGFATNARKLTLTLNSTVSTLKVKGFHRSLITSVVWFNTYRVTPVSVECGQTDRQTDRHADVTGSFNTAWFQQLLLLTLTSDASDGRPSSRQLTRSSATRETVIEPFNVIQGHQLSDTSRKSAPYGHTSRMQLYMDNIIPCILSGPVFSAILSHTDCKSLQIIGQLFR